MIWISYKYSIILMHIFFLKLCEWSADVRIEKFRVIPRLNVIESIPEENY